MSRVPGILPRMHQAPQSGQHRERPGGVFLLGCTGHTHWWEKGSPTEGTSGRGLGEGLGGEGLQVQEGGSACQGRWGGGIEGWGKQAEGAAAELPREASPCLGDRGELAAGPGWEGAGAPSWHRATGVQAPVIPTLGTRPLAPGRGRS